MEKNKKKKCRSLTINFGNFYTVIFILRQANLTTTLKFEKVGGGEIKKYLEKKEEYFLQMENTVVLEKEILLEKAIKIVEDED